MDNTNIEIKTKNNKVVEVRLTIPKYPTHAILYEPKTSKGTLRTTKINGQLLYSGNIAKHNRAIMMHFLHTTFTELFNEKKEVLQLIVNDLLPCKIKMEWHTVPNHETVKMIKGKVISHPVLPNKIYDPAFDCDNQFPYFKAFQDTLTKDLKILPDDNVKYVPNTGEIEYHPINNFENRKLVFVITKHNMQFKKVWLEFFKFWN